MRSSPAAAAEPLALDVTAPDAGERIVAAATASFGQLDVLVNNAGTARWRPLDEVPDEDWQAAWELNVMAPLAGHARGGARRWPSAAGGGSSTSARPPPSGPRR